MTTPEAKKSACDFTEGETGAFSCRCGARWNGRGACHCSGCHQLHHEWCPR